MNFFRKQLNVAEATDANLVIHSLGGSTEAFCEIVIRYQTLLCSLAYSAVGDIKNSEDIAQEAFVEAWKKLDSLNDPEKLKSWLCGILKFKISHFRRKEQNQPVTNSVELNDSSDIAGEESELEQSAILQQQQALVWKVLNELDENYRAPLILFYREQQSVQKVAQELDLSEDVVKQRLSRGRKLLKELMSEFVEEAIVNSKPGIAFTAGVVALINSVAPPAKAAGAGVVAYKTGSLAGYTTFLTVLASFSGLVSSYFGLRAGLDQSRTDRERKNTIKIVVYFFAVVIVYIIGLLSLKHFALAEGASPNTFMFLAQGVVLAFVITFIYLARKMLKNASQIRHEERLAQPEKFLRAVDQLNSKQSEYISSLKLFGVPLIHAQFGIPEKDYKPAVGWIASGSKAYGLLFALGGIAIAPISVGIVSVGILTVGAVGIGIIGLGTVGIGIIGFGSSAIAYKAYGAFSAMGWESAFSNGFSLAKDAAIAPVAIALETNNELASEIADLTLFGNTYLYLLAIIAIMVIVPSILFANKVRARMK